MRFSQFTDLAAELGLSQKTLSSWVGISSGSLNWARQRGTFKGDASSLLAGIQLMLDTIKTADLSPDAVNFHHGRWLASWMEEPNLCGNKPSSRLLAQTWTGSNQSGRATMDYCGDGLW